MNCVNNYLASIYQYETVDLEITLTADDESTILEDVQNVIVSFQQSGINRTEKTLGNGVEIDEEKLFVHLSQEDTSTMKEGALLIQVNILYTSEERDVSVIGQLEVLNNLHKEIME